MTLQELEKIRDSFMYQLFMQWWALADAAEIIDREIDQMKQDQLLSESKANPT